MAGFNLGTVLFTVLSLAAVALAFFISRLYRQRQMMKGLVNFCFSMPSNDLHLIYSSLVLHIILCLDISL